MKKILITGGAGFIGSALIKELQNYNYEIFVIDDLSFGNRDSIKIPSTNFYRVSILEFDKITRFVHKINPHYLIHLASVSFIPYCNLNSFLTTKINIKGTINILDSLYRLSHIEKLFFASTAAVYPNYDKALKESFRPEPLEIYGLSKLVGEHLCNEFYLKTKIPTIICRFFNIYGPGETNPHLIPQIQRQINSGKRTIKLGNLAPKRDFTYISDAAVIVRLLLERFNRGIEIFNVGSGIEHSVREIVKIFERRIGEKIIIKVDSSRVRKRERMHLLADTSKLKNFIYWLPKISIDEGIRTLIE